MKSNNAQRQIRHKRVRAKVIGTQDRLRLDVYRSNQHIYGQIIDDGKGHTLVSASDLDMKGKKVTPKDNMGRKTAIAFRVGELLAKKALEKGIKQVAFDRGGYKYHGRVKAVAEGAREGGLKF